MNYRLVARLLGTISWIIGGFMAASLPFAWFGTSADAEQRGLLGLFVSVLICLAVGGVLRRVGGAHPGPLYRKEAMAVVGLSWMLATVLGALPFIISRTGMLRDAGGSPVAMGIVDAMFESQSGFSTTGATVLTKIEDPEMVPRCILFWRSTTHFLGGLGIIVLFVAILGQGSAGKALMRAEMPGPSKEGSHTRMQQTALIFAGIYVSLNLVLIAILWLAGGMTIFDAICHAFGTMATGGFSTYDTSLGHFAHDPQTNGLLIEVTVIIFMVLAGTNFGLLYLLFVRREPGKLVENLEFRVYICVILAVTALVVAFGMIADDFLPGREQGDSIGWLRELARAVRYGLFQVVSIMTTTGYGTHDFDRWNSFGRGVLFLLMFVGGCAGSTGGGLKVIRHILFFKVLRIEIEKSFHPQVVRPLRIRGEPVEDDTLGHNILVYFSMVLVIFVFSWMMIVTFEPDATWVRGGRPLDNKLIDAASSVSATLNNIGPGLGIVGATQNYAHFSWASKLLFVFLMMMGRVEIFVILVWVIPGFWRKR